MKGRMSLKMLGIGIIIIIAVLVVALYYNM